MIHIPAQLNTIDDLRQFILPPSAVYVSPKKITAHWFLASQVEEFEAIQLSKIAGLRFGDGNGLRVAFHPTVAYEPKDFTIQIPRAGMSEAMSGPCRKFSGDIWKARERLFPFLGGFSEMALRHIINLPTIEYPHEWLNESVTPSSFAEQLLRATKECKKPFEFATRDDITWVGNRTALEWWRKRYRVYLTMSQANAMMASIGIQKRRSYIEGMMFTAWGLSLKLLTNKKS